ncbi:MAG TPA: ABC transporter permease [Candidatus Dormibacteraeota bacterium]|nr:ABC transporter permease [Candidatus Dormibacteraeota bacterium]
MGVAQRVNAVDDRDDALVRATVQTRRARAVRRLLRHHGGVTGGIVLLALVVVALLAPVVAPYNPIAISTAILQPPSGQHVLGTDNFGRDIFSRIIYGARVSLRMGFVAVAIGAVIGTTMGVVAGAYGGFIDSALMRLVDALMAFPGILLALAVTAMLGPGLTNAMIAVGIGFIPSFARLVRASTLQVRHTTYVEAARAVGCGDGRLIARHIFPNVLTPVLVLATLGVASAILIGAALSFLGLGAQPPTAEWGIMLSDGREFMRRAWWIMAFPGLAITITVMAANLVGDGLRDAFDPRLTL